MWPLWLLAAPTRRIDLYMYIYNILYIYIYIWCICGETAEERIQNVAPHFSVNITNYNLFTFFPPSFDQDFKNRAVMAAQKHFKENIKNISYNNNKYVYSNGNLVKGL